MSDLEASITFSVKFYMTQKAKMMGMEQCLAHIIRKIKLASVCLVCSVKNISLFETFSKSTLCMDVGIAMLYS